MQAPVVLRQGIARQRIERGERLVHQNNVRAGRQGARHADALALAAGELVRKARAIAEIEAHQLQQLVDARGLALLVPAEQPRRDGDVLRHRHVREQADLLEHVADAPPQRDGIERRAHRRRRCAPARGRLGQAIDELQQRGLAGAGCADDDQKFARLHIERDVIERRRSITEALADILERDRRMLRHGRP